MAILDASSPLDVEAALARQNYLADTGLATAAFLALKLGKPLFLEGEPGVGKTALALAVKEAMQARFIRLQCYSGIEVTQAVYDWDFPRQLLAIRSTVEGPVDAATVRSVYGPEFLVERPILRAVRHAGPVVLLIDEIDRADDEFEAFLLEVLERGEVTVPELDERDPVSSELVIILTSNRTREVHDALKRRCVYHWIEHPDVEREARILRTLRREVPAHLADEVAALMHQLRAAALTKRPGISETLDLTDSLHALGAATVTPEVFDQVIGTVIKHRDDLAEARRAVSSAPARIAHPHRRDDVR